MLDRAVRAKLFSAEAKERNHSQNHNNQTDEIDDAMHFASPIWNMRADSREAASPTKQPLAGTVPSQMHFHSVG